MEPLTVAERFRRKKAVKLVYGHAEAFEQAPEEVLVPPPTTLRVMLGQGCLRAPFWRTIYFHLKWGAKMGFRQWAKMGPKVGFGAKG